MPRYADESSSSSESANLLGNSTESATLALQSRWRKLDDSNSHIMSDTPYVAASAAGPRYSIISDKYSLSPDPKEWGSNVSPDLVEADDDIHDPSSRDRDASWGSTFFSQRAFVDLGSVILLVVLLVAIFVGYPVISTFMAHPASNLGAFGPGGTNSSGQVPESPRGLIDKDTPESAYTKASWNNGPEMQLVFSDEFNVDGRTFYPGDDPYWEAVDLWYWETDNLNWYDPSAIITANGSLVISLDAQPDGGLSYTGGMIQSWNMFCFTGGYVEANVSLPGVNDIAGLWPAIWTMGNLGRAGYGASLEGLWPYSYDSCDVGTAPNQTFNGQPAEALTSGSPPGTSLSYLAGQRLSRCTCDGESHPGPKHSDGTFVGRAAPEIDMFEAQITGTPLAGQVSQSAQWAPFNHGYIWLNTSENEVIPNPSVSVQNTYIGGVDQQATSVVTNTDQECYEDEGGCYSIYGFEYLPGFDDAYITWVANNQVAWTLNVAGMGADQLVNISARPIPQEPMYIIMNLGMSNSFGAVDIAGLTPLFPVHMRVDYIRVYQPQDAINIGCDPVDFPTESYISQYSEAYTNPNLTQWTSAPGGNGYNQSFPKNSFLGQC